MNKREQKRTNDVTDSKHNIGLEYGVRAAVFYGNLREQTGESGFPRMPTGSLCCSYRNLRKPPGVLWENVI